MAQRHVNAALGLMCILLASGCVAIDTRTSPAPSEPRYADPFEPVNRAVYRFNDGFDQAVAAPVSEGYRRITPKFFRDRVRNFSDNLRTPIWAVNNALQLDWEDAGEATGRFLINSTVGLGGLFDPMGAWSGVEKEEEDFGQTLATYGVPPGPYIVLPLAGPTTVRDAAGGVVDFAFAPLTWINFANRDEIRAGLNITSAIDTRTRVESFLEQVRGSAEPYSNLRSVYAQARESAIHEDADFLESLPDFN